MTQQTLYSPFLDEPSGSAHGSSETLSPKRDGASPAAASVLEQLPGDLRVLFPITERYIYLNHASVSPPSTAVRDSMVHALDGIMRDAPRMWTELERIHGATRASAARLVNAKSHQIAFLRNTSEALSVVANGVSWQPGDNVVSTSVEFPANVYPWSRLQMTRGVELRLQKERDGRLHTDDLLALIDGRTRVVTVSWVQYGTGQRLDIRRIGRHCRTRGILFVVDAVQGLGALQLDVERDYVDAFAANAQKFLLGPKGIALLYMSDEAVERVSPSVIGWTAVRNSEDYLRHELQFRDGALRYEGGALNTIGICGLGAALDLFLKVGPPRIEEYLLSLNRYLSDELERRGYRVLNPREVGEASAMVLCQHERYPAEELFARLDARNIIISARLGRLRIAPHLYNTRDEMDALLDALPE